ncbi:MAG: putative toxin-antitoxin system toxin component, PIN family, partial [bacterium]
MRVVFDTNIFISAFIVPGSQGERAFLLARRKRFALCTSVAILTETAKKLR